MCSTAHRNGPRMHQTHRSTCPGSKLACMPTSRPRKQCRTRDSTSTRATHAEHHTAQHKVAHPRRGSPPRNHPPHRLPHARARTLPPISTSVPPCLEVTGTGSRRDGIGPQRGPWRHLFSTCQKKPRKEPLSSLPEPNSRSIYSPIMIEKGVMMHIPKVIIISDLPHFLRKHRFSTKQKII